MPVQGVIYSQDFIKDKILQPDDVQYRQQIEQMQRQILQIVGACSETRSSLAQRLYIQISPVAEWTWLAAGVPHHRCEKSMCARVILARNCSLTRTGTLKVLSTWRVYGTFNII